MKNEKTLEEKILEETMSICQECIMRLQCVEKLCPIYRIEKLVSGEPDEDERTDK